MSSASGGRPITDYALPLAAALLAALSLFAIMLALKKPRHDRVWQPDLAPTPHIVRAGDLVSIAPYRDWRYDADAPVAEDWTSFGPVAPGDVRRAWLVVEPHPGLPLMAHTLVIFQFADGRVAGISVEARKEAHERYSPFWGAFNRFELLYQWASPRDLLTRRAVMMDRTLYLYPLRLDPAEVQAFFSALVATTQSIAARPRFYNTLTSNCTNELAKSAGLGWDMAFVFTGLAGHALHARGRIAMTGDFVSVRQAARIDDRVRSLATAPHDSFNAALFGPP